MPDPFEAETVEVKDSLIQNRNAGQGLFAKRKIEFSEAVAFYNGFKFKSIENYRNYLTDCSQKFNYFDCQLGSVPTLFSEYLVISHFLRELKNYNATLGHKVNHDPDHPNVAMGAIEHPRFGSIHFFFALRTIFEGEEILVDYRYPKIDEIARNLPWYRWPSKARNSPKTVNT